jgi:hypothetical protein
VYNFLIGLFRERVRAIVEDTLAGRLKSKIAELTERHSARSATALARRQLP